MGLDATAIGFIAVSLIQSSVLLFFLMLILRPKFNKVRISSLGQRRKRQFFFIEGVFTLILICLFLIQASVNLAFAIIIALVSGVLLVSILFFYLVSVRIFNLSFFADVKLWHVLLTIILGSILILAGFVDSGIAFGIPIFLTLTQLSSLILYAILRLKREQGRILNVRHITLTLLLSSILTFIICFAVLNAIAVKDIFSIRQSLKVCNKLIIWNSYALDGTETGWGTEEIVVNNKKIINDVYDLFCHSGFELVHMPGAFATADVIDVSICKNDDEIGGFMIISGTLHIESQFHRYAPSENQLLTCLRELVGAHKGN